MRFIACVTMYLLAIAILMLPEAALAMPAITCHCFTDRSFDPSQPAKADPYFLATTQNSFFAEVFGVEKRTIVMKKQQGTSSDDLWIAYWLAAKTQTPAETLLQAKEGKAAWPDVIAAQRLATKKLSPRFATALKAKGATAHLAETVVDDLVTSHKLLADADLAALRKAGASSQELILAIVLAAKTGQPSLQIYREVKNGGRTWGSLLQDAAIDTKNMQQEISRLLKL